VFFNTTNPHHICHMKKMANHDAFWKLNKHLSYPDDGPSAELKAVLLDLDLWPRYTREWVSCGAKGGPNWTYEACMGF
jgi:hypothetical protein